MCSSETGGELPAVEPVLQGATGEMVGGGGVEGMQGASKVAWVAAGPCARRMEATQGQTTAGNHGSGGAAKLQ